MSICMYGGWNKIPSSNVDCPRGIPYYEKLSLPPDGSIELIVQGSLGLTGNNKAVMQGKNKNNEAHSSAMTKVLGPT